MYINFEGLVSRNSLEVPVFVSNTIMKKRNLYFGLTNEVISHYTPFALEKKKSKQSVSNVFGIIMLQLNSGSRGWFQLIMTDQN